MSPEDLSLVEAAAAIRAGELSPVQYVLSLFTRMSQVELRVQAWTTVDHENGLAEARKCETEAAKKQFRGPLHGVPVGIKDIFYTKDLRPTMRSQLFESFVPSYDAHAVQRLKAAGDLGPRKPVTPRHGDRARGTRRHPCALEHPPGG